MLTTPHTLAGLAIVSRLSPPWLSLPLAFLSHYLLDILPHWNWRPAWRPLNLIGIALDFLLALFFIFLFASSSPSPWLLLAGGFLPMTVDLADIPYYFFNWRGFWERYVIFNRRYQGRAGVLPGIATQLLVSLLSLWALLSR